MSAFDNNDKDHLLYEIEDFLENYSLIEFFEIIMYVLKWREESGENQ